MLEGENNDETVKDTKPDLGMSRLAIQIGRLVDRLPHGEFVIVIVKPHGKKPTVTVKDFATRQVLGGEPT